MNCNECGKEVEQAGAATATEAMCDHYEREHDYFK